MTVGKDCHLYLGSTGSTKRSGFVSDTGIFDFDALTVAAGGEVTPTHDLTGENNLLKLAVSNYLVTCEPKHDKNNNSDSGPGLIQTGLCSYGSRLET